MDKWLILVVFWLLNWMFGLIDDSCGFAWFLPSGIDEARQFRVLGRSLAVSYMCKTLRKPSLSEFHPNWLCQVGHFGITNPKREEKTLKSLEQINV